MLLPPSAIHKMKAPERSFPRKRLMQELKPFRLKLLELAFRAHKAAPSQDRLTIVGAAIVEIRSKHDDAVLATLEKISY